MDRHLQPGRDLLPRDRGHPADGRDRAQQGHPGQHARDPGSRAHHRQRPLFGRLLKPIDHALEFAEKDRPQSVAEWRREILGGAGKHPPPRMDRGQLLRSEQYHCRPRPLLRDYAACRSFAGHRARRRAARIGARRMVEDTRANRMGNSRCHRRRDRDRRVPVVQDRSRSGAETRSDRGGARGGAKALGRGPGASGKGREQVMALVESSKSWKEEKRRQEEQVRLAEQKRRDEEKTAAGGRGAKASRGDAAPADARHRKEEEPRRRLDEQLRPEAARMERSGRAGPSRNHQGRDRPAKASPQADQLAQGEAALARREYRGSLRNPETAGAGRQRPGPDQARRDVCERRASNRTTISPTSGTVWRRKGVTLAPPPAGTGWRARLQPAEIKQADRVVRSMAAALTPAMRRPSGCAETEAGDSWPRGSGGEIHGE